MMLSSLAIVVSAGEGGSDPQSCLDKSINIASEAKITTTNGCWTVSENLATLVDGNKETGLLSSHSESWVNIYFEFDKEIQFDKLVFTVNSKGQTSPSRDGTFFSDTTNSNYNLVIRLENKAGTKILDATYNTEGNTEIVIDEITAAAYKMHLAWQCNWNNQLPLWEVETYATRPEHTAPGEPVIVQATCTENGSSSVTCADCGVTEVTTLWALGHKPSGEWLETNDGKHYQVCLNDNCNEKVQLGAHAYSGDCDDTCNTCNAKRTNVVDHTWDNACDAKCNVCNLDRTPADHVYDDPCLDTTCNICNAVRTDLADHTWDNNCDAECNECGTTRTPSDHVSSSTCDEVCNECGAAITPTTEHNLSGVCDTECDDCGAVNADAVAHTWANPCLDTTCDVCGKTRPTTDLTAHTWTNDCDPDCNKCGTTRTPYAHAYDNKCGDAECNECGAIRTEFEEPHSWKNACDTDCDVCGTTRTPSEHVYDNACADTTCNVCNATRTELSEHTWTNACDASCDACGTTRTPSEHVYDNACADTTCNVCNEERTTLSSHTYGEWTVTLEATRKEAGEQQRTCAACAKVEKETIDALGGLGGGAIAAIVVGSVAVVGGGGFCGYWFIFRKKIA